MVNDFGSEWEEFQFDSHDIDILRDAYNQYFDIFPIGHYLNIKRQIFGKKKYRPLSSNHFELILKNCE